MWLVRCACGYESIPQYASVAMTLGRAHYDRAADSAHDIVLVHTPTQQAWELFPPA